MLCVFATLYVYLYMCMCVQVYLWIGQQMEPGMIVHVYIMYILYVYAHVRIMCISIYACIDRATKDCSYIYYTYMRMYTCICRYLCSRVYVYMCKLDCRWRHEWLLMFLLYVYAHVRMYMRICVDWMADGAKNDCSRYQRSSHVEPSKYCQLVGTGSIFLHTHTRTNTHTRTHKQTHT